MTGSTKLSIAQMRRDVAVLFDDGLPNLVVIDPKVLTLGKEMCEEIITSTYLFFKNKCVPFESSWVTLKFDRDTCIMVSIRYRLREWNNEEVLFRRICVRRLRLIV